MDFHQIISINIGNVNLVVINVENYVKHVIVCQECPAIGHLFPS